MSLDMAGLFGHRKVEALQQSSQVKRWQQDGSALFGAVANVSRSTSSTIHTVTAGKILYITSITVVVTEPFDSVHTLSDGNGGSNRFNGFPVTGIGGDKPTLTITFETPLYFVTSIYWNSGGTSGLASLTFTGWEE